MGADDGQGHGEARQGDAEWRRRLVARLVGDEAAREGRAFAPEGAIALEIAFAKARSELSYLLDLGRAHQLPAVGNVMGDDVWIRLGEATLHFTLERTALRFVIVKGGAGACALTWDPARRGLFDAVGAPVDVEREIRGAVDEVVAAFRRAEPLARGASPSNPPTRTLPDPREYEAMVPDRRPADDFASHAAHEPETPKE